MIEESLGQRSTYGIYSFVASQIIRQEIDEVRLQEILNRIKIESPPPFGGGSAVKVVYDGNPKMKQEYADIIAALEIAEKRRLTMEEKLAAHAQMVDEAVRNLQLRGSDAHTLVQALPPLTRERTLAIFRKNKRTPKKEVQQLLMKDLFFLKASKEKMAAMRVQDILKVMLKIKK